jgi:TusA-related sulfurtransferase
MAKKKLKTRLSNKNVGIILVIIAVVLAGIVAVGYFSFAGSGKKSCNIPANTALTKYPHKGGYFFLPRASGNYGYNKNIFLKPPKGAPNDTIAGKGMVQFVNDAAYQWALTDSGSNPFTPGDSYSTGHATHKSGNVIDLYAVNNKLFPYYSYHLMGNKFVKNPDYDKSRTEDLAIALIKTGVVSQIISSDKNVVNDVNKWAKKNKQSQVMVYKKEHLDHFHVKIRLTAYDCK